MNFVIFVEISMTLNKSTKFTRYNEEKIKIMK